MAAGEEKMEEPDARPAMARAAARPSFFWSFLSMFYMGFAKHNTHVHQEHGEGELSSRLRDEYTNIGILTAFLGALVCSFLYGLPTMKTAAASQAEDDVEDLVGLSDIAEHFCAVSFVLLILATVMSVANLIIVDILVDVLVPEFHAKTPVAARLPYMAGVAGIIAFVISLALSAPILFGRAAGYAMMGMVGASAVVVMLAFWRLIYAADAAVYELTCAAGGPKPAMTATGTGSTATS